jgi:hypothetical protein
VPSREGEHEMMGHHEIVDRIRALLQSGDFGRIGVVEALAFSFARACAAVSQRLVRCDRLLQQGLRSEAIQLAEAEPNLLEALAVLDFPELHHWDELVELRGLEPAPRLPIDLARRLNEVITEQAPLQDLLRSHRRLALQRAPLKSRIDVLRKLSAQDPGNPIWGNDLHGFEAARLQQIPEEAREAASKRDLARLQGLLAEVEQPAWREPPPRALASALRRAEARLRGEKTRVMVAGLVDRLNDAFAARDPIRGRLVRRELAELHMTLDAEAAERVKPALGWLDEEDRRDQADRDHEASLTALDHILDSPATPSPMELERLARRVLAHGRGVPEGLQQLYASRLRSAMLARSRRHRWIAAGAAASLLLAGGLAFTVIHGRARAYDADQAATSISDLLELGQLHEAGSLVAHLESAEPDLMKYPHLIAACTRVKAAQDQEVDRALRFDKALRAAERAAASIRPPPELEAARSLARLSTETEALENLARRRAAALETERSRADQALGARLAELDRVISGVEKQVESADAARPDHPEVVAAVAEAGASLTGVMNESGLASEVVQRAARSLSSRLEAARHRLDDRLRPARLEAAITGAVAYSPAGPGFVNLVGFTSALQAFAKALPSTTRARAFTATLAEQPLWGAIADWDCLSAGWKGRGDHPAISPVEAGVRAEQCRFFLVQHPGSPDGETIATYQRFMAAIARRGPEGDGPLSKLRELLSDTQIENVWMVTVKPPGARAAKRYYLTGPPLPDARSLRYLANHKGTEKTVHVVRASREETDLSPQAKIAARFKPIFAQGPERIAWEETMLELIEQVRTQPGIDPVFQVFLLRRIVALAAEGSEPFRERIAEFQDRVARADVNVKVNWMDPDNPAAVDVRSRAAALVPALPGLAPCRRKILERRAEVDRQVSRRPRTVGWLARDAGVWNIRTGSLLPQQGSLVVALLAANGRAAWRVIGTIAQGKPELTVVDDPGLAEGRPVFIMPCDAR